MITMNNIAKAETIINASISEVWNALTDPDMIKKYMFGTTVISDWKEGSRITWKGEWEGKSYEDKGKILLLEPQTKLQYSHFSPMAGLDDKPENYHIVTIDLTKEDDHTHISLEQNNNANEEAKEHSERNWKMMLNSLKKILEGNN
jgi:uncharacterized protein YndB with AHSA1/START domain